MSLNRMPGFGKSGMSRMYRRRSIDGPSLRHVRRDGALPSHRTVPLRPVDPELVESSDGGVVGQVEMQRRHRNVAVGNRRAVGAFGGDEPEILAADPVVLAPA